MRKLVIAALLTALLTSVVLGQKQLKPWGDWSKKDAEKMLNDSPWGQTQAETDTSNMFFVPGAGTGPDVGANTESNRLRQGATNQAVNVNFRIRFFTAKPIRQAFARLIELNQANLTKELAAQLTAWSDAHSDDWIIVAVTFDSTDRRYSGPVMQAFGSATSDAVKNNTYLERKDGKRVFLTEYQAPGSDGAGAKFVFARVLDGKPFLTANSGEVRFHSEFATGSTNVKLDRRYTVADMVYDGKLEY